MAGELTGGTAVLVPGVEAPSSVTAVRSLGRQGARPIVVTDDPTLPVCRSRYVHETFVVPDPADDLAGYRDGLLTLARRQDVATILPLREADSYVLAKNRPAFAEHVSVPWPEYEVVRGVQDWLALRDAAIPAGVAVPETAPLDEWTDWNRRLVIKPRYSVLERGNQLVSPGVEFVMPGNPPDVEAIIESMGHVPVVQEFVPGAGEYGYFALFDHGTPVASFQHRRVRSYTYSGGASVYRRSVDIPSLRMAGEELLEAVGWHGPAMVEFKRDPRDGTFRLIEINPRFWGSLALAVHAGVDFPWLYYQLAHDVSIKPSSDFRTGVGSHLLRGELSYLHSVWRYEFEHVDRPSLPRALSAVVGSIVSQPTFDVLSLDDPRPFVGDVSDAFRALGPSLRLGPSGVDARNARPDQG